LIVAHHFSDGNRIPQKLKARFSGRQKKRRRRANNRDIGDKSTLLAYVKTHPVDPTLTLTFENTRVSINGDTAIVIGRRVERRRREDNNREGLAYARYRRTYIKRQGRWQLLAEHLESIPAERTAVKIDTKVYDDYVGEYECDLRLRRR